MYLIYNKKTGRVLLTYLKQVKVEDEIYYSFINSHEKEDKKIMPNKEYEDVLKHKELTDEQKRLFRIGKLNIKDL